MKAHYCKLSIKAIGLLLAALMALPLLSLPAAAFGTTSDGTAYYNRQTTVYPVMDKVTANGGWTSYAASNNDSVYNIAPAFYKDGDSKGASSMPGYLSFGTSFRHKDNDNTYRVYYDYDFEEPLWAAAQKGDLSVSYIANLTNDKHWNAERHLKTWTAYPTTWVSTYSKIVITHDTGDKNRDTTLTLGRGQFAPLGPDPWGLFFGALGQACSCGSSEVSNISIMLADMVGPKVTSIYTTRLRSDGGMEPYNDFRGGDTAYINLKFDEPIRFADDQTMRMDAADVPKLKLRIKRMSDNIEQTGILVDASLVSLDDNILTFKYTVPEYYSLSGQPVRPNYYIYEVAPYSQQNWVSSEETFDLKLFAKRTTQVNYRSGSRKTTSRIVDLAGNPIEIGGSAVALKAPAYLDNVPSTVRRIEIAGTTQEIPKTTTEISEVFARVGQKLGFFVYFSEEMRYAEEASNTAFKFRIAYSDAQGREIGWDMQQPFASVKLRLRAELNIKRGGVPVTAVAKYITNVQDGLNGPQVSRVYFETEEPISSDMAPLIYAGQTKALPIGINSIYVDHTPPAPGDPDPAAYAFADARGNLWDEELTLVDTTDAARVMPAQQLWLDSVVPTATTGLVSGAHGYVPVSYAGTDDPTAFFFPVLVSDQTGPGEDYRSLTNGVTGTFMWRDDTGNSVDYAYEYAVTGDAVRPTADKYSRSATGQRNAFTQTDSGNYIHIRLLPEVQYNIGDSKIVIFPTDNAGNVGETAFALDYQMDLVGPKITKEGFSTAFSVDHGIMTVNVDVRDVSTLNTVEYQWTDRGAALGEWNPVTSFNSGATDNHKPFTIIRTPLAGDVNHRYTLHVRATDVHGYTTETGFDVDYDLALPSYNIEFVTNPGTMLAQHSVKVHIPPGGDIFPPAGVASRLLVLLKKPGTSDQYWARLFKYPDLSGEAAAVDILDIGPGADGWTSAVRHDDWMGFWPSSGVWYEHTSLDDAQKAELYSYLPQSYRQVELTLIAWRPLTIYSPDTMIPDSEVRSTRTYYLNCASGANIGAGDRIHYVAVSRKSKVYPTMWQNSVNSRVFSGMGGPPDVPDYPRSLDGAVWGVSLSNWRVPAYGLSDIDFDSPDTRFALYKTGADASDTPLFSTPLLAKSSQDIVIPPGVATATGSYKVVVTAKSRTTGHIDSGMFDTIYIDRREALSYGVSRLTSYGDVPGNDVKVVTTADYALAADTRPSEVFVSADPDAEQYLRFAADLAADSLGTARPVTFIKVWNQSAWYNFDLFIDTNKYPWIALTGSGLDYRVRPMSTSATRDYIVSAYLDGGFWSDNIAKAACIPLIPGDNVIKYQIATSSGYYSPVQQLLIHAGAAKPEITMALSPAKAAGTTQGSVTISLSALNSTVVAPDTLTVGLASVNGGVPDAGLVEDFLANEDYEITLTENGSYVFYVVDKYHNYGFSSVTVDYIDREAPTLTVTDNSDSAKNTFDFEAIISDAIDASTAKLYIGFDDAYSALLDVEPGTLFEVPEAAQWAATGLSQSGLYAAATTTGAGGEKTISLSGAFKYDRSAGAPATSARTVTVYAVDGAGNRSTAYSATLTVRNEPAEYTLGQLIDGSFTATFSKPVMLVTPNEGSLVPVYAHTKAKLPFFGNGTYQIKYSDIFGELYDSSIVVDQYDPRYDCTVSISETGPTNQDVQVLINAAFNEEITLELPASIAGGTIVPARDALGAVVGASITMSSNGTVTYGLKPKDSAFPTEPRTIVVGNIDKTPPTVDVSWTYTADVIAGETAGDIIASLEVSEEIEPLQGSGTTHTFTLDSQTPHVFHYRDLAGNAGSITATPAAVIIEKPVVDDNTAPDYELSVYRSVSGVSTKAAGYTRAGYDALLDKATAFPLFSGALQLRFQVFDENQTTLSIKETPVPDAVLVSGTTVTVSGNADFTVLITDVKGNQTEVPVSITNADNTAPTGTVTYVKTSPYSIRGYLSTSDDRADQVTLQNTSGVKVETVAGEHAGEYYHEFLDNESFTFLFADAAGNTGSVIAAVTSLDMTAPVGTITQWVPYFINSSGVAEQGRLAEKPTNSDVSVYIQFNKSVDTITPTIVDGKGSLADVSLTQAADSATVVFRQNAKISLTYTALNRKRNIILLEVGIIDKVAPVITVTPGASGLKSATYTFTANEKVFMEDVDSPKNEASLLRVAATSFTKVYELEGEYELKFTDLAGNSAVTKVTVSGIDRVAPGVSIADLPATKESVSAYNLAHGTAIVHTVTNRSVTIKASLDEPGTITFRSVVHPVAAGEQVPLTVDVNGTYEIVATDLAGMTTRYQFRIDSIDKANPQLLLPGGTIPVRQGTSDDDFEASALAAVLVSDNVDLSPTVTIFDKSEVDLSKPGTYTIAFKATDAAGNEQIASFFVRVYDQNALEVRINGQPAQPNETLFIGGDGPRLITVVVGNLPSGSGGAEPYKMYWKAGLNTPGQMKSATQFTGSFTAPRGGFYTLYVMTQSREAYITYVYLQP